MKGNEWSFGDFEICQRFLIYGAICLASLLSVIDSLPIRLWRDLLYHFNIKHERALLLSFELECLHLGKCVTFFRV